MTRTCRTVLIVEDDTLIRDLLAEIIESDGFAVATAANGKEGLARLGEVEHPCLILLDLMMPVMSGGEFLGRLRSDDILATIPVVVVSAWPDEAAKVRAQTQGYVKKPVELDRLLRVVRDFCMTQRHGAGDGSPNVSPRGLR